MFPPLYLAGFLLLALIPAFQSVSGPHLADLNVLLPPLTTIPVQYRLQGSDGCFTWSWDHHDILSVQPEYNDSRQCSTSARLISIAPYSGRKETAVFASDLRTGTVIRCEIFIDKISRIKIFHHSLKIDLDGLATLRIRAFDDEENVFSSLVGLQFMWQLMPESSEASRAHNHLVHVPLRETPLSDSVDIDTQIKMEESGVGSDLYIVRGTEIGHEIVSVHFLEPQLEHVGDKIVLTVAEAMSLDPPSPIFAIVGACVQYKLRVLRQNTSQVVALPSPYHRWSVVNTSVARIDSLMGFATALKLGVTSIHVEDTRVAGHRQISSLHVVLPDKLVLYMLPATISCDAIGGMEDIPSNFLWYLVVGQNYVIHLRVFSGSQSICITENDDVKLQDDHCAYWETSLVPGNIAAKHGWKTSRCLKATSQGLGRLAASLSYPTGDSDETSVLHVVQEVMVCDPVRIDMGERYEYSRTIQLPWAPGVYQEVELTPKGGCAKTAGDYKWVSSDMDTVAVSATGIVQARRPGQSIIKVVSVFDSMNYDEVVIEVSVPSFMVMLQSFPVEVVVGAYLHAAVTLKTSIGSFFYKCDAFSSFVRWQVFSGGGAQPFKVVNATEEAHAFDTMPQVEAYKSLYSPPCAVTHLYASNAGRATLHATLSKELQFSEFQVASDGPVILKASSLVAAYQPLIVRQSGDGNPFGGYWVNMGEEQTSGHDMVWDSLDELFLIPGTRMDVILLGGPERWDQEIEFIDTVDISVEEMNPVEDGVLMEKTSTSGGRVYNIFCQALGTFRLIFSRGNLVGDDHPLPALESVELSVICSFPSSITLIANEPVNKPDLIKSATQADRGPGNVRVSPTIVANSCTIRIASVGIHKSGKAFANSSALCLKWELSGCEGLAYWKDADGGLQWSGATWERFLVLQNASGLCMVRATVIGFLDSMTGPLFEKASLLLESSENVLTDAIRLQLVSSLRVVPEAALLFFHPDAKVALSILGGTCYLDPVVNDTQVVEVIQHSPSAQCIDLMLGVRGLGTAVVTVHDIGLAPPLAASAVVQVADVDWIKILSKEEIGLLVGTTKSFDISAGIRDRSVFHSSQYAYMNIHVHLEDGVLGLVNEDGVSKLSSGKILGPNFTVRAESFGVTTLRVSARQRSGREILSQVVKVEVYVPLRIHPEDIFLAPGASYVLTVKGGPTSGILVQYTSMDDSIAMVQRYSGRLSAISPGNTRLHAGAYDTGGNLICETYGEVKVGIPSSMILNLQSDQLGVGHEMPIYPISPEGNLFSFYDLCKNYKWTIEDDQVLSFQTTRSSHTTKYEHILSGEAEKSFSDYQDSGDLGFISVLYGRSAGRTHVAVSFSCDFVSPGNFSHSMFYNASESLSVIPKLPLSLGEHAMWVLPPFYTTSMLLPSLSEPYLHWDSRGHKGNIIYSVLKSYGGNNDGIQQDAIVVNGGSIKTMDSNNIGCILAKDRTTGRTDIASCVRVAEVAQVRVTTKEFPSHVTDLVVGAKLKLLINFRDAIGTRFYEAHNVIQVDAYTNHPDVISIQTINDKHIMHDSNGIVQLQAMQHGRALVQISIKDNPKKADYILVSVGASLVPRNPVLHVGSHLNFSINGEGMVDLELGQWFSANESILFIESISGKARAIGEGKTEVCFQSSELNLRTVVTVKRVDLVLVDAPAEILTNVPHPAMGYYFSVRFSDSHGHKFEPASNSMGDLYDCGVDPTFIGKAQAWRDDTGNLYCLFFPHSPQQLAHTSSELKASRQELKRSNSDGHINMSIIAYLREAQQVTGSAQALFCGGFAVLEMHMLNLTPSSNNSLITIVGNTDVEIRWHERSLMSVSHHSSDNSGIGGWAEYEVRVLGDQSFADKIIITLPATGQKEEIDVKYEHGQAATSAPRGNGAILLVILLCILVLLLTILYLKLLDKPQQSRQPTVPARVGTATPEHSPTSNTPWTPRTPQPFTEYVRKTLDDTPYLRREGRRRFDPQRTY